MKAHCVFLLCGLFITASPFISLGDDTFHTFTTPDGRTLNAVIKAHNAQSGKIQIEREDGKKLWTLPTVFSEPDQEYVRQWIVADQFMSPAQFKIEVDSEKNQDTQYEKQDDGSKVKADETTEIIYAVTLENRTGFVLEDLRVEFRAFIRKHGYEGTKTSNRVDGGRLKIDEIATGKKVTEHTQPILILTDYVTVKEESTPSGGGVYVAGSYYAKKTYEEYLKGFWIRVYGPAIDGIPAIREWCYPSDTMDDYAWQDQTTPAPHLATATVTGQRHNVSFKLMESDPEKAIELLKEAYEKNPDSRAAHDIGYTYIYRLKPPNIPKGLEWAEKAAKDDSIAACRLLSGVYSTYYGHTNFYNKEKVVQYGEQALSLDPSCYTSHIMMALAYALNSEFNKAVVHQEKAIELYKGAGREPKPGYLSKIEAKLKEFIRLQLESEE